MFPRLSVTERSNGTEPAEVGVPLTLSVKAPVLVAVSPSERVTEPPEAGIDVPLTDQVKG